MGRFKTTVPLYAELRTPYPPEFFATVATKLGFSKQDALIDLGTGPGLLALGFARYVGRITGVDPETAMLAVARQAAEQQRQPFTLIEGTAETLPENIGRFEWNRGKDCAEGLRIDGKPPRSICFRSTRICGARDPHGRRALGDRARRARSGSPPPASGRAG